jgi:hypothetical protein
MQDIKSFEQAQKEELFNKVMKQLEGLNAQSSLLNVLSDLLTNENIINEVVIVKEHLTHNENDEHNNVAIVAITTYNQYVTSSLTASEIKIKDAADYDALKVVSKDFEDMLLDTFIDTESYDGIIKDVTVTTMFPAGDYNGVMPLKKSVFKYKKGKMQLDSQWTITD